jgi:AcrR family transcriptional regulator
MTDGDADTTRAALSRDMILRSALSILDEQGYQGLTLRALGKRLHFSYTAIYRHLPGKAALLDGITEVLWLKALNMDAVEDAVDGPWQNVLEGLAWHLRETLLEHPNAVSLVATHPISTRNEFAAIARMLSMLQDCGYEVTDQSINLIMNLTVFVIGHVLAESAPPAGGAGGVADPGLLHDVAHAEASLGLLLEPLLESGRYDMDEQFRQGVRALIGMQSNHRDAANGETDV